MSQLEKDLICYYEMDTVAATLTDKVGNYDLTLTAPAPTSLTGPRSEATGAFFDDRLTKYYHASPTKLVHKGPRTMACWVKLTSNTVLARPFNLVSPTGTYYHFTLQIWTTHALVPAGNKGTIVVGYRTQDDLGAAVGDATPTSTITDTDWHFIAALYNPAGNSIQIYMDDDLKLDTAPKVTNPETHSTVALSLQQYAAAAVDYYDLGLYGVGYWNRILTGPELSQLYKSGDGIRYDKITGDRVKGQVAQNPGVPPGLRDWMKHVNEYT